MAWIETPDGELVNLDKISSIKVDRYYDKYRVIAYEAVGVGQEGGWERYPLSEAKETKTQALPDLAVIKKMLEAKKISVRAEDEPTQMVPPIASTDPT